MDGVEDAPDGTAMRQVPSDTIAWSQTAWISECGELRNRFYNVLTGKWVWGEPRHAVLDAQGRAGYRINGRFRTIGHAVALAWIPRRTIAKKLQPVRCKSGHEIIAHNLYWLDEPPDDEDEVELVGNRAEDDTDSLPLDQEWRRVAFKMGLVSCCADVFISRDGHIRRMRDDRVMCGTLSLGDHRFFPIENVGLVPLRRLSDLIFDGSRESVRIPPRIKRVMRLLRENQLDVAAVAIALRVKMNTAWSYIYTAMRYMSTDSAEKHTSRLITCVDLLPLMDKLSRESPLILHGRLRDVTHLVTRLLSADISWKCNAQRYNEVCAVRALLQRKYERSE